MSAAVFDTYVNKPDGTRMHFDILVPTTLQDLEQVYTYGRQYLTGKQVVGATLTAQECRYCHVEEPTLEVLASFQRQGFHIIEMEGCA